MRPSDQLQRRLLGGFHRKTEHMVSIKIVEMGLRACSDSVGRQTTATNKLRTPKQRARVGEIASQ